MRILYRFPEFRGIQPWDVLLPTFDDYERARYGDVMPKLSFMDFLRLMRNLWESRN